MGKFCYDLRIEMTFHGMTQNLDARKENKHIRLHKKKSGSSAWQTQQTERHTHTPQANKKS